MPLKVRKNPENPETAEVLAESIIKIAEGFESLLKTKLNDDAIVALLREMPGTKNMARKEISIVLENLKTLKGYYLRRN